MTPVVLVAIAGLMGVVALASFAAVVTIRARRFRTREGRRVAGPRPSFLGLGNLVDLTRRGPLGALEAYAREARGESFVFHCGATPHFVPLGDDAVRQVLYNRDGQFSRNTGALTALFRRGLLTSEGERWRKHRRLLEPAFRKDRARATVATIADCTGELLAAWTARTGTPLRPNRDLSALLLTILGRSAFGYDLGDRSELRERLHRSLVTLTTEVVRRHLAPAPYWKLLRNRRVSDAQACLTEVVDGIVAYGEARLAGAEPADDLLALLLQAREEGRISPQDVHDEILNILIAGHETSATAMCWVVAMLAKHPDVQARARREIDHVFGGRPPTPDGVERLSYVTQVIKETMRLYSPVPFSIHRAERDGFVGETFVPQGTAIDLLSYLVHRDPTIWPDPTRFEPERFGDAGADVPPHRFFPFLIGPHTCIGMHLAMTELRVATAMLLQRFELAPHVGALRENMRISLHPAGLEILLRPRPARALPAQERPSTPRVASVRKVAACPYHETI